ncbi:hypothetical protein [Pantoea sp. B65]|uniref:hypothetical protein n=1 Tax=Pantoea sp. B65 TaxID=2813359 RepID=UPI0039B691D3
MQTIDTGGINAAPTEEYLPPDVGEPLMAPVPKVAAVQAIDTGGINPAPTEEYLPPDVREPFMAPVT